MGRALRGPCGAGRHLLVAAPGTRRPGRQRQRVERRTAGMEEGPAGAGEPDWKAVALMLPEALGPVAVDLPGGGHEWAVGVRIYGSPGQLRLEWFGGHHHVCQLTGPPVVHGDRLLASTAEHDQLVLRSFDPSDTWPVFPAGCTAWEAYGQGLR